MRLIEKAPAFCSSCHQQKPNTLHVDFDAYWDGPVLDAANGMKQSIDDLIICKDCLTAAGILIGMEDGVKVRQENRELGRANKRLDEQIQSQKKVISDLTHTLQEAQKNPDVLKRAGGRPSIRVPAGVN